MVPTAVFAHRGIIFRFTLFLFFILPRYLFQNIAMPPAKELTLPERSLAFGSLAECQSYLLHGEKWANLAF